MKVELIDYTHNPVEVIGKAAGQCYGVTGNNAKRVKHAISKGHYSILRFANATFEISGISLVCSHQLVRIAHAGILQMSMRYIDGPFNVITPASISDNQKLMDLYDDLHLYSDGFYKTAREAGVKKEDARYGLLTGTQTALTMTGNFQMWNHFIKLRSAKEAQWEIRAVALHIQASLAAIAPEVFLVDGDGV